MKKIITTILSVGIILSSISVFADTPSVYLNGEKMKFDVDPYIAEERTMVPFRAIFEAVNADVFWDGDSNTVVAAKNDTDKVTSIVLQIGKSDAFVNDQKVILDKAAEITDDRTFVPLRFVVESLGADVKWDQETYSVVISTK